MDYRTKKTMNYGSLLFLASLAAFSFACTGSLEIPADAVVIQHVNIVDVRDGTVDSDKTVVILGSKIISIGDAGDFVGTGQRSVDASGKYLIPGLWDMHTHIFNNNDPEQGANTWHFPLMLAHGVLGVRDMWVKMESIDQVRQWNTEIKKGNLAAPYIAAFGTILDGPGSVLRADSVETAEQAREMVRRYNEAGSRFVKTYTRLSPEAYFAIHEEAAQYNLPVLGHIPKQVKASEAAEAGHRSFEHLDGLFVEWSTDEDSLRGEPNYHPYFYAEHVVSTFDSTKARTIFEVLARNESWQVPTLCLWKVATVLGMEEVEQSAIHNTIPHWEKAEWGEMEGWMRYRPTVPALAESYTKMWQLLLEVVYEMHETGSKFMTGTDIGNPFVYPGHSVHDEMEIFVEAGFSPLEALQTATLNPVRYLGASDSLGLIAPQMIASLVIVEGNPLEDIRNARRIDTVIQQGRVFDRQALDALYPRAE